MRSRYLQILYRNAELYLYGLRSIDRKSEQIESQLHKSIETKGADRAHGIGKDHRLFQGLSPKTTRD